MQKHYIIILAILLLVIGVVLFSAFIKEEQLIGGCAGVSFEYLQECCDNRWLEGDNIVKIKCVGKWEIENNKCAWKCGEGVVSEEKSCSLDSDCACGVNIETEDCFYGNENYVDTSVQCPDFCTGIAGNLEIRCINNECKQVQKIKTEFCGFSTNAECNLNEDCKVGGCSGQVCEGKKEGTITTCEFRECYDAEKFGLSCGCINNKCQWH